MSFRIEVEIRELVFDVPFVLWDTPFVEVSILIEEDWLVGQSQGGDRSTLRLALRRSGVHYPTSSGDPAVVGHEHLGRLESADDLFFSSRNQAMTE